MAEKKQSPKMLRITWVKSAIGYSEQHKATIRALGLRRLNQTVIHEEYATLRGNAAQSQSSCKN